MESLFLLIPLALLFAGLTVYAFFWAVDNRQFDDLDNAGSAILFDDDRGANPAAAAVPAAAPATVPASAGAAGGEHDRG